MILPSALEDGSRTTWPLSSALPPMGALTSAPGTARAHVRAVLAGWGLADLIDVCELVVSELTTNAVKASTGPTGRLLYVNGRMPVVRVCLLSDGSQVLVEVHDQALGLPVLRDADADAVSGRGLPMVHALTVGRWGWQTAQGQSGKCVWAALSA
jgi:anti-sigma regulatory factor (Ser/Thr protein kinase)